MKGSKYFKCYTAKPLHLPLPVPPCGGGYFNFGSLRKAPQELLRKGLDKNQGFLSLDSVVKISSEGHCEH